MRSVAAVFGWVFVVLGGGLVLLVIASWPPGGLMFALPFVFLIPGAFLCLLGAVLVRLGRRRGPPAGINTEPQ